VVAKLQIFFDSTLLKSLWKILEECGRKWKIIHTFANDSVKENPIYL